MGRLDELLKKAGLTEDVLNKMSDDDIVSLLGKKETKQKLKEVTETGNDGLFLENVEKKLPELKKTLNKPFELFVRKIGAKPTATFVKIVGYNSETSELVAFHNGKLYAIKKDEQINSMKELETARKEDRQKKAETKANAKPKSGKKK